MTVSAHASPSADARPAAHAARAQGTPGTPGPRARGREDAPPDAFAELLQSLGDGTNLGEEPTSQALGEDQPAEGRETDPAGLPGFPPGLAPQPAALAPIGLDLAARAGAAASSSAKGYGSATELLQATLGTSGPGARGRGLDDVPGKAGAAASAGLRIDLPAQRAASSSAGDIDVAALLQAAPAAMQAAQHTNVAAQLEERGLSLAGVGAEPAFALKEPRPLDAPAAPLQAEMRAGPGDAEFAEELSAQVQLMLDGGLDSAELRMNPAELGPIRISLNVNEQTADIRFEAAHASTREGIERSLSELREMLAQEGLSLGQAQVGQGGSQGGWGQQREPGAPPSGTANGLNTGRGAGDAGESISAPRPRALRGTLDLYA